MTADFRKELEGRVHHRFISMGMPENAARRCAATATASYLAAQPGEYFDLVQVEAVKIFVSIIPDSASSMLQAWAGVAQLMSAAVDIIIDEPTADDDLTPDELAAFDKEFPADFISGAPDHYLVNGHTDSCGCDTHRYGHSPKCTVWDNLDFAHKPTICEITRTMCTHHPRHTYGQECPGDFSPRHLHPVHSLTCVTQGGHASGDCDKLRPVCQHAPAHTYGEACR